MEVIVNKHWSRAVHRTGVGRACRTGKHWQHTQDPHRSKPDRVQHQEREEDTGSQFNQEVKHN